MPDHDNGDDESRISLAQSRSLGEIGEALSDALIEFADDWMEVQGMSDERAEVATVFTILEAMIFLTLTRMLEPEERLEAWRAISISTRRGLARYHQDTGD